jgi:EAL domain-containing protein (putative c-di-GMP-specific phosphodiesterase class I)
MDPWVFDVDGVTLRAYFQRYQLNLAHGGRPSRLTTESTISGELLTRPDDTSVSVEEFFSALSVEQHFRILTWHLGIATTLARDAHAHTSINLHNSVLHKAEDRQRLLDVLQGHETPVTFEFTETYPMPSVREANVLLREIRRLGHTTALDDFGTGLNGMSLLTDFDFDIIKIDRSLTFDLTLRLEKKKMLALILKMLEVLGRDHVVEGIEEVDVYEFLSEIGYVQFQGFLFDKPMPVGDFISQQQLGEPRP